MEYAVVKVVTIVIVKGIKLEFIVLLVLNNEGGGFLFPWKVVGGVMFKKVGSLRLLAEALNFIVLRFFNSEAVGLTLGRAPGIIVVTVGFEEADLRLLTGAMAIIVIVSLPLTPTCRNFFLVPFVVCIRILFLLPKFLKFSLNILGVFALIVVAELTPCSPGLQSLHLGLKLKLGRNLGNAALLDEFRILRVHIVPFMTQFPAGSPAAAAMFRLVGYVETLPDYLPINIHSRKVDEPSPNESTNDDGLRSEVLPDLYCC
jgi:hypothetical protein